MTMTTRDDRRRHLPRRFELSKPTAISRHGDWLSISSTTGIGHFDHLQRTGV